MPRTNSPVDTIAHFERAIEEIPPEMANSMRRRQRDVASKKDQAESNETLLRLRVTALTTRIKRRLA